MTVWEVIEQTLAHRKPARTPVWLAEQLGESIQTIWNWKSRRVPPARYRSIADALGITVDQLEGVEPLPWAQEFAWPFSSELQEKVEALSSEELQALERGLWDLLGDTPPARLRREGGITHSGEDMAQRAVAEETSRRATSTGKSRQKDSAKK